MRRAALAGSLVRLNLVVKKQQQQYRFSAAGSKGSPGLVDHCKLLQKIHMDQQPYHVKRKRIQGVLRKMETNYIHWLRECGTKESLLVLETLAGVSSYLKKGRSATVNVQQRDKEEGEEWTGASPYFLPGVNDWLCVLLERGARHASRPDECMTLLWAAAELELADTPTLQHLCRQLLKEEYTGSAAPGELVRVIQLVSLLVKRCRMPIPQIDYLLCRLSAASLDSRESINVLSSLLRMRARNSVEVVRAVSRRAVEHVATYTARDVIYALEAIALLNCCHESYAGAVLNRCIALHAELKPAELGSVCKYVAMLNVSRRNNETAFFCSKELRRLLPALLRRAEQLLGRFSLRDARCVMGCLQQHKVHHSVVFSRLTPLVSEN
ncbi:hypothetical protein, conserved [Trypanosoma cruzi]|uniref:Uncharacterized protein n=1 Tax=Trypanosoma cruzi (strain CL Brener) TaxID=353153 RepID=Q4DTJ7_TRYCC|nr:hypothetical protein, conserved [Trypanosoma cruzi]EAN95843.1 hypothetical protein, conserved [Trypanosoma cruzi]|eukprot:XP_817694.1 hypothetical protein [Trypanosoma cruzi strain CL Brener]